MLKKIRKDLKLSKELDVFLGNESRKYYIEKRYHSNMFFLYFYFLRKKGLDLNDFFDQEIKKKDQ